MIGDILIQTEDGSVYFSEGGKAFQQLNMEKPEATQALADLLKRSGGKAIGLAAAVHGKFGNEHMTNGGCFHFLTDLEKTLPPND
jgi:hypothetical protein